MLIYCILMDNLRCLLEIRPLSLHMLIIIPPQVDLLCREWKHCFPVLKLGSLFIFTPIIVTNTLLTALVLLRSWMQSSRHYLKRLFRWKFELWSLLFDQLVTLYSIIRILLKHKAVVVLIAPEQKDVLRLWCFGFVAGTSELLIS